MLDHDKFGLIDEYGRNALVDERGRWRPEYDGIGHLVDSLQAYASDGRLGNVFLRAVLANDLFGAVETADARNRLVLVQLVTFIYRELPAACWGSRKKVRAWIAGNDIRTNDEVTPR